MEERITWVVRAVLPANIRNETRLAAAQANITIQALVERALRREIALIGRASKKKAA